MSESILSADSQVCSVCGVTIAENVVQFSNGSAGTRARLYARVCQYTRNAACLNQDSTQIGEVLKSDGFLPGDDLPLSFG